MSSKSSFLRKQQGVVLVLVALSIVVLMGVAALAIDLSHAYVNKTRLQNLADALALSAAISLNKQESSTAITDKEAYAENYAKTTTFPLFESATGNKEVQDALAGTDFTFTFATTLSNTATDWQAAGAIDGAKFVRVTMSNMDVATWFAPIFNLISGGDFSSVAVSNSAVAGTSPIVPCDLTPFAMCADVDSSGNVKDDNCDDNTNGNLGNDCYGYEISALYCMKEQDPSNSTDPTSNKYDPLCPSTTNFGPGNFGFLDFSTKAVPNPALKYCTAGDPACKTNCALEKDPDTGEVTIPTQTGQQFGNAKTGFNTRFGQYPNNDNTLNSTDHPPDKVTGESLGGTVNGELTNGESETTKIHGVDTPNPLYHNYVQTVGSETELSDIYTNYLNAYSSGIGIDEANGTQGRRILAIPMVDCREELNGKSNTRVVGYGCFYMAREYGNTSIPYEYDPKPYPADKKYIYGVFLHSDACTGGGTPTSTSDYGFYKVQLYKDPFGGHS
jgi:Flp pilus assembly protein TadG